MKLFKVTIKASGKVTASLPFWQSREQIEVYDNWWKEKEYLFACVTLFADSEQEAIDKAVKLTNPYRQMIGRHIYTVPLKRL